MARRWNCPPPNASARIGSDGVLDGVRFLEHTADTGVEARGASLEECLARAAAGMFATFARPARGGPRGPVLAVELVAGEPRELLVAWLEELLYLSEANGLALLEFCVEPIQDGGLVALVRGPRFGPGVAVVGPAIKAVTRHGLELSRTRAGWVARVIFDI